MHDASFAYGHGTGTGLDMSAPWGRLGRERAVAKVTHTESAPKLHENPNE